MRELEQIVEGCILNTVRESMPIETILRSYLDESLEENIEQIREKVEEVIEPIKEEEIKQAIKDKPAEPTIETSAESSEQGANLDEETKLILVLIQKQLNHQNNLNPLI